MNLVNDNYYYVYMQLEDENGKYYPVEDESLYQAVVGKSVKMLYDYLDDNFKCNVIEGTKREDAPAQEQNDNTTAKLGLPNTGIKISFVAIITIFVFSIIKFVSYRKLKNIK